LLLLSLLMDFLWVFWKLYLILFWELNIIFSEHFISFYSQKICSNFDFRISKVELKDLIEKERIYKMYIYNTLHFFKEKIFTLLLHILYASLIFSDNSRSYRMFLVSFLRIFSSLLRIAIDKSWLLLSKCYNLLWR